MRVLRQFTSYLRVMRHARRNRLDLAQAMIRRPQLLLGTVGFELGVVSSAQVDAGLKLLAELKVASIVACEYCLDIGSALARYDGVTEAQLRDLHDHRRSPAFTDRERVVLDLADALTRAPAHIDEGLRTRAEEDFTPAQMVELTAVIAWENQRARLNQGLGIRPSGFSDGAFCVRPEAELLVP